VRRALLCLSLWLWPAVHTHAQDACPACPVRCEQQPHSDTSPTSERAAAAAPDKLVDLNLADEGALLELPGIGPARARAILDYRRSHGSFRSVAQLLQIKGIGRALLRQLRPLVTLSGAAG
jgi:competence ComEA-like helix-hairpin-helix protein